MIGRVVILTTDGGDNAPEEFVGVFASLSSMKEFAINNKKELFILDYEFPDFIDSVDLAINKSLDCGSSNNYYFEVKEVL